MITEDKESLIGKIKALSETVWDKRAHGEAIDEWLKNFSEDVEGEKSERLNALYLLQQFMYFGGRELRELERALYRDLFRYPIIEKIRKDHGDTTDSVEIKRLFEEEQKKCRFLPVGNPSESGSHLLYYFRQENQIPKDYFIPGHAAFKTTRGAEGTRTTTLRQPDVTRYIFLDDFCGSGNQGVQSTEDLVKELKLLNPNLRICYYVVFGTTEGLSKIKTDVPFDEVACLVELDASFKCFDTNSRYFLRLMDGVDKAFSKEIMEKYGNRVNVSDPLGFCDGQLLIGFSHNTPDNTLPVFWSEDAGWNPIFKRYAKKQ